MACRVLCLFGMSSATDREMCLEGTSEKKKRTRCDCCAERLGLILLSRLLRWVPRNEQARQQWEGVDGAGK